MLVRRLTGLLVALLGAPPFLLMVAGCSFDAQDSRQFFFPGEFPRTSAIFVDVERGRECATNADLAMGIDVQKRDQAFLGGKSGMFGLDFRPESLARCDGLPEKVLYQGAFPEGSAACLNPDRIGADTTGVNRYENAMEAGQAWCKEHALAPPPSEAWIDGDGNRYRCENIAWPSFKAEEPFPNACLDSGTLRTDFQDPRKLPPLRPVVWTNLVNLQIEGENQNSLRKLAGTESYDAGAAATALLQPSVDGAFEFTATETETERMAGFALGGLPDVDPSNVDIIYGVILKKTGELIVSEFEREVFTSTYAPQDRIRLVLYGGVVLYFKNGDLMHISRSPVGNALLRISVSLKELNGTITDAKASF